MALLNNIDTIIFTSYRYYTGITYFNLASNFSKVSFFSFFFLPFTSKYLLLFVQEMKQLRADLATATLARDKMRREVEDANKILTEKKEEMDNIAKVGPPVLNKKKVWPQVEVSPSTLRFLQYYTVNLQRCPGSLW